MNELMPARGESAFLTAGFEDVLLDAASASSTARIALLCVC